MTSVVLLSDIHGNLPALEAVAAHIRAARPDAVYVLGDMVNGCPWSAEVLDLLTAADWPMLLGNHDDAVLQLGTARMEPRYADRPRFAALWWTREHLESRHLALLAGLPVERTVSLPQTSAIRLLHGIPGNFFVGFLPHATDAWAARQLASVTEGTVAGGHTHAGMVRRFVDAESSQRSWLVINAGSVGAPYDGDTRASYAWLEGDRTGWRAEIRRVEYDLHRVDAGFRRSGLLTEGNAVAEMFRRSVLSGLPWVADFAWWLRDKPSTDFRDMWEALRQYDALHGPGHWAFPYARA